MKPRAISNERKVKIFLRLLKIHALCVRSWVLICLVPRPHYYAWPMLFGSRGPRKFLRPRPGGGGGGSYFPYILLNEIQTMFSQLAKQSTRVLPADLCTDHAHYVKKTQINGLQKKQKHGSRRRDCFSLLYFGNSQIY